MVWAGRAADETAAVRAAVEALGDGGTLKLERRVYRLTAEGARKLFLAPSNNRTGEKNVVFPIVDKRDVTIDGNGATLVFDGDVFPFATLRSRGVTIRNLTVTKPHAVVAGFAVTAADDAGFTVRFAPDTCPYEVKDGELVFDVDGRPNSTRDGLMSLHALDKFRVHYLVTERSEANSRDKDAYPSTYSAVSVEDRGNHEVRFTYRDADRGRRLCTKIPYAIGRPLGINLYPRCNIAFFFEDAEGVRLEDVTIRRFGGMGLVAQRSGDLTLSRFRLLPQDAGLASTTADMMQINSCYGKVVIENCEGADSMDDVIDIHGNYMGLARSDGRSAVLRNYRDWGKPTNDDHYGFFPVRAGDTLSFLDGQNRREVARLRVATLASDPKDLSHVTVAFADGGALPASLPAETLVENLTLYPDVTFRNNTFRHYPHLRFSGRGKYLIEGNRLENAMAAFLIHDLRACWYETGPVADMTIRNNVFVDCNAQGGKAFITVGSLGWPSGGHMGRVLLEGNRYEKLKGERIIAWDAEIEDRDAAVRAAEVSVDFGEKYGKVNPMIHCASWCSRFANSNCAKDGEELRKLNLQAYRTHDAPLVHEGQRIIDTHFIFPLMHLDPKDPRNYCFEPTDKFLKMVREQDRMRVLYRLGTSIEHTPDAFATNTRNPSDHAKYAEVLAGIVRHYTKGWADGFTWDIRYWELFNEPDVGPCWRGSRDEFAHLFVTCLKRLKSEFPELRIGGPGLGWSFGTLQKVLAACKQEGVKPDFISWHWYGVDADKLVAYPAKMRAFADEAGFKDAELILNEWHYLVENDWAALRSTGDTYVRTHTGPAGQNGIDSAAFTLYVSAKFQDTCLGQSYFYGCGYDWDWGWVDRRTREKVKPYYALQAMGELIAECTDKVRAASATKGVAPFAATGADGRKAVVLIADYRSGVDRFDVTLKRLDGLALESVRILDQERNFAPVEAAVKDGRLTLQKRNRESSCFILRFAR